jgi:hypothetical protein
VQALLILFGFPTITIVPAVTGVPSYYGLPVLLRPCCGMCLAIAAAVAEVVAVIVVPAAFSIPLTTAFSGVRCCSCQHHATFHTSPKGVSEFLVFYD